MNIKGILRSTAAKLIVFAGIVGCFAGALFLVENTITDFAANGLDQMVYRFEGDFADSSYMHQQLGIMCAEMANAFEMAWTQRNSAGSIRILRETILAEWAIKRSAMTR